MKTSWTHRGRARVAVVAAILPAFGGQYMLDTGFVLICPLVSSHA